MKMAKYIIIGLFLISIIFLLSNTALADTIDIKNTSIDYTSYREMVVNEPGVVYQIKITNTGTREKEYEIIPDSEVIRNIGTYRVDPFDTITLKPGEQETVYFYLAIEKDVSGRHVIPVAIKTGFSETNINLVARAIGPLQPEKKSSLIASVFKVIMIIILIIIILLALIFGFRKIRREKEEEFEDVEPDFDDDIETYY